jgi:hypothetical protein
MGQNLVGGQMGQDKGAARRHMGGKVLDFKGTLLLYTASGVTASPKAGPRFGKPRIEALLRTRQISRDSLSSNNLEEGSPHDTSGSAQLKSEERKYSI